MFYLKETVFMCVCRDLYSLACEHLWWVSIIIYRIMAPNKCEKQLGSLPKFPYTCFMFDSDKVHAVHLWWINMDFTQKTSCTCQFCYESMKNIKIIFLVPIFRLITEVIHRSYFVGYNKIRFSVCKEHGSWLVCTLINILLIVIYWLYFCVCYY